MSTTAGPAPALTLQELARWAWRQLTSMRTALLLLLLLALASVPGSVVPQQAIAPVEVTRWREDHPTLAPVYDRLGLFSVYDSAWFSAVYLLLMVSLVGCIVPRLGVYARAVRAAPPAAPRHLGRLPASVAVHSTADPDEALARAERVLGRRYRVARAADSVAAERGHLREAGNLLFHLAVIVVLVGFALGQMLGYKGGAIVLVGRGFSNSLTQYDEFSPGSLFDPESLPPLSFTVDDFDVTFVEEGPHRGQPVDFGADLTYRESPGEEARSYRLEVNEPLVVDGVSVFLVGHGYAPVLTVTDGTGEVAFSGPVPFLPQDASFASYGVLKVADAQPEAIGLDGFFFPTYSFTMDSGPFSSYPDALNPAMSMLAYHGDLGMDSGAPQSVFELDTDEMEQFLKADGKPLRLDMAPGKTIELPDGLGSVTFDGWQRWVKVQVSDSPGKGIALGGMVLALAGLTASLFVRRRRMWVRVTATGDRTLVEVGGLERSGSAAESLAEEVAAVAREVAGLEPPEILDRQEVPAVASEVER